MITFWIVDCLCLAGILAAAAMVVASNDHLAAVIALSALGVLLSVLFVVLAAPDVALAEALVGSIALPTLYLVAIGKIRGDVRQADITSRTGSRDD